MLLVFENNGFGVQVTVLVFKCNGYSVKRGPVLAVCAPSSYHRVTLFSVRK
jgi:hypothetical protein